MRAVSGHEAPAVTFGDFVAAHQQRVNRLAQRLLGWGARSDVDDVVQEVFVSAWRGLHKFRGQSSHWTWLARFTINQCRRQHRRRLLGLSLLKRWAGRMWPDPPHDPLERDEQLSAVREAVRRLPSRYREVVVLRYLEEMDMPEMMRVLKLSRSAADARLHRAREMLRSALVGIAED